MMIMVEGCWYSLKKVHQHGRKNRNHIINEMSEHLPIAQFMSSI